MALTALILTAALFAGAWALYRICCLFWGGLMALEAWLTPRVGADRAEVCSALVLCFSAFWGVAWLALEAIRR